MIGSARYGAALSRHTEPASAVGEVVGQVLDATGPAPDLAVLFVSGRHLDVFDDLVAVCTDLLRPTTLLGVSAVGVLAGSEEVEAGPAVSLWAGRTGPVVPVRLETLPGDPPLVAGLPEALAPGSTVLLLADPFTFDVEGLIGRLDAEAPDTRLVGGLASAGAGPGQNRLVLDGSIHRDGAVGVILPPEVTVRAVVSQGCRPVGSPWVVTASEGPFLLELAGRPALERVTELLAGLSADERRLAAQGLHVGIVAREHGVDEFGRGDFLIRGVLGADPERGAVAVGDSVEVGQVVQFQVRDAVSADEDLHRSLEGVEGSGALVFTCNGRGTHLFPRPDHDATAISDALRAPIAGMFCAGELGPVGHRNAIHGFTASMLVFD
jgi:small ligand-binding sensory domain FIST